MNKTKVAVLFGGRSEEHDISIKSAMELAAGIDTDKYEPYYIGITKSGVWKMCEKPCMEWEKYAENQVVFSPDRNTHGLLIKKNEGYEILSVDVVFPMIHGKFGEDGSIQGLLELSGVPYVGCDIQSSVICMDKALAYIVVKNAGIEVPDFRIIQDNDSPETEDLAYPVFVKPARSGSSFGVNKVCREDDLDMAINEARKYDSKILIEQAIFGSEVGCAVLGDGTEIERRDFPAQIMKGTKFKSISTATYNTMAIDVEGNLWTWGSMNWSGQMGIEKEVCGQNVRHSRRGVLQVYKQ